ncbi:hypothetical protein PSQ40_04805 [Curvibacter sp. HBC61]|uniref:LexA repressor DNA-binding domain-containing protein n=1 Tax=Curvibacter cyanobacteriorum TaxID=3026422 RepID=A0ABT5MV13_9BURK|nr:hypothetical protein [Curvibacter sp. HBC61]MDD0837885.1 hypothetical protein [Curvibacter sp. HBC61]
MLLTSAQQSVLEWVRANLRVAPAEAIAAHFGWASPNAAYEHLQALVRKGYLERVGNGLRVIVSNTSPMSLEDQALEFRIKAQGALLEAEMADYRLTGEAHHKAAAELHQALMTKLIAERSERAVRAMEAERGLDHA